MREPDTQDGMHALLSPDDPAPCAFVNEAGASRVVLLCEHAGRLVPGRLGRLGLEAEAFEQHIAWDIGAEGVARAMADTLDAPLLLQRYSRLVIDCNRKLTSPDLIPETADGTPVPGNRNLSPQARQVRYAEIHQPYHQAVSDLLDRRAPSGRTVLVMIHSFTPRLQTQGQDRPMHLGFLFNRDARLGRALAGAVRAEHPELLVAENAPYQCSDQSDYAVPVHAEPRGLLHALVEIRNDLIRDPADQVRWAGILTRALTRALETLKETAR